MKFNNSIESIGSMKIQLSNTELDLTKLKVGKIYKFEFEHEGKLVSIPKALIKSINVDTSELECELLVDHKDNTNHTDIAKSISMKLVDDKGNVLIGG